MRILIINGPNLNQLGHREPEIYGSLTMEQVMEQLRAEVTETELDFFQSNSEGALIDRLQQQDYNAVIINPGAYTHYSYAIADCLRNIQKPKVEVHISNIYKREEFRRKSVTAEHCDAVLSGFGTDGYALALQYLLRNHKV
ncbi:MAG: type II 3-dehydroquinate dehydratase [Chryseobacterium sp.]|nr:MAG: type II 3-dehydroquinate dehydratase [Chryseobacterium sp.]